MAANLLVPSTKTEGAAHLPSSRAFQGPRVAALTLKQARKLLLAGWLATIA